MVLEENPPLPPPWWQVFATARVKTRHELAGDGWQYQHKVSKVFGGWFHSTKDHETGDFSSQKIEEKNSLCHIITESLASHHHHHHHAHVSPPPTLLEKMLSMH